MTDRPHPFLLGASLTVYATGTASYALQAPDGWDLRYWLAVAATLAGAAGIALYTHRALTWRKEDR